MAEPKIMTQPLPQILDELEDYIKRVEEAVKEAQDAAVIARGAAKEAELSGAEAAEAARRAAEAAVAEVREETNLKLKWLDKRVTALEENLARLRTGVADEAVAVDKAFLAAKVMHTKESPFLEK